MGRAPKPDEHRTGLQRRLAAEVRVGMERAGRTQADLSRLTGIGEPHISLLLRGLRQGTIAAWDKLLDAAHGRAEVAIRVPKVVAPPPDIEKIAVEAFKPFTLAQSAPSRAAASVNPLNPRRPV